MVYSTYRIKYKSSEAKYTHKLIKYKKVFPTQKICAGSACAKRKRCYDVSLSRQEGSTTRHLASAV